MTDEALTKRLEALEQRLQDLELMVDVTMRLMSATRPLATALQHFNATESQEQAIYRLFDSYVARLASDEREHPSFGDFRNRIAEIFPIERDNCEFLQLLVDTLRLERAAYQHLHGYMIRCDWPQLIAAAPKWKL